MRSMSAPDVLRWLCWALVILVVASALVTLGISQGLLVGPLSVPSDAGLAERLAAYRDLDRQANTIYLVNNLITSGVFLVGALVGVALRAFATPGPARDAMASLFIIGGTLGVLGALVNIGVNQAATYFGCGDCGLATEELIAQDWALTIGWTLQSWVAVGAITVVGLGVMVAGAMVAVSTAWRWLSFAIGILLLVAAALQVAGMGDIATLITAGTSGVLVTIWSALLAVWAGRSEPAPALAAA